VKTSGRGAKLTILFFAVILALAGVGAGFAHWSSTVTITETVQTGSLLIGMTELSCAEFYEDGGIFYAGEVEGKDVGDCSCAYDLTSLRTGPCGTGYGKANVTITNAYPSYRCHVTYRVKSLGTVPVIMETIVIYDPTGELLWHEANAPAETPSEQFLGYLYNDKDGDGEYDVGEEVLSFTKVNNIVTQIHCGDSVKSEIDLHVEQDGTLQNHTYKAVIEVIGVQWNKSQWNT
jgi:hypothetical protein